MNKIFHFRRATGKKNPLRQNFLPPWKSNGASLTQPYTISVSVKPIILPKITHLIPLTYTQYSNILSLIICIPHNLKGSHIKNVAQNHFAIVDLNFDHLHNFASIKPAMSSKITHLIHPPYNPPLSSLSTFLLTSVV